MQFSRLLEYPRTFNSFLFFVSSCCYFDLIFSGHAKFFSVTLAETLLLPPLAGPNIQCHQCASQRVDLFAVGGIVTAQNTCHFFASKVPWISEQNLSDSNENHLVSGEIGGVNHLFAGVHFPRKTQKQKFTSAVESDVPSVIFA